MNLNLHYDALRKWYLFANTPLYLYKHFREEQSVQVLASTYSSSQLIKSFSGVAAQGLNNIDDLIRLYAIIFALTFKDYSDVRSFFENLAEYPLKWSSEIRNIYLNSFRPVNMFAIDKKNKVSVVDKILSSNPSTNISFKIKHK